MKLEIFILLQILTFPLFSYPIEEEVKLKKIISEKYKIQAETIEKKYFKLYRLVLKWEGVPFLQGGNSQKGIGTIEFISKITEELQAATVTGSPSQVFKKVTLRKVGELPASGDIVFFQNRKGEVFHAGIYLQNDKFVHVHAKYGVVVENLSEPLYQKSFLAYGAVSR